MRKLNTKDIRSYVEENISSFHENRIKKLKELKLKEVLKRKNPYLFKAKNILQAQELVKKLLEAYLSSQEETVFGEFLEGLAIFICSKVYSGYKSSAEGIDLEFRKDGLHYIVSIKSGPNWGNSQQVKKMIDNFNKAKKILKTSNRKINIQAINGCCYGIEDSSDKKEDYKKLCGQRFWEFISDDTNLYTEIIEPIGYKAKEKNDYFYKVYSQIINDFTQKFMKDFCINGVINWKKLVEFNSAKN
ncbi:MAG: cytosolic protein [Candidatus Melainabacteria bacterium]|nr:cytosolic protein [Candidatus Melainabacteria bacterium]